MAVGEHAQILLAHGRELDSSHDTEKCPTSSLGMDVPRGCLQMRHLLRLLITAHCGTARWVVWKGLEALTPTPIRLVILYETPGNTKVVRKVGLEPTRLMYSASGPKPDASTSFATPASKERAF